jgi:hypothetical protein
MAVPIHWSSQMASRSMTVHQLALSGDLSGDRCPGVLYYSPLLPKRSPKIQHGAEWSISQLDLLIFWPHANAIERGRCVSNCLQQTYVPHAMRWCSTSTAALPE